MKRTLAEYWLWLGVIAVAIAGLYALVPVFGRGPFGISQEFFDTALVVHVDLSVMIWFFSMTCMGASLLLTRDGTGWPYWQKTGFLCVAAATALIAFAPLGTCVPVKSNYIPVLHNPMFLLGLAILMAGLLASLLPQVLTYLLPARLRTLGPIELGAFLASCVVILGLVGYAIGAEHVQEGLELQQHYEKLFWVGGHVMQFSFTLLVMAAWLVLLEALGGKLPARNWMLVAYAAPVVGAVASLAGLSHPSDSDNFTVYETQMMIELGGVGPVILLCLLPWRFQYLATRANRAYASALIVSLILFFAGGGLGLMISGQNVTIPAHYHGIIVGITQALMGVAYVMLPRFGYRSVAHTRLAFWQPIVYGAGQLMHIGGLAYCGGYGILRKTAGGYQNLAPDIKVALGIFGVGGLLAITGGILFVIVMLCAKKAPSASLQATMLGDRA